jgi:hypothetical protein
LIWTDRDPKIADHDPGGENIYRTVDGKTALYRNCGEIDAFRVKSVDDR